MSDVTPIGLSKTASLGGCVPPNAPAAVDAPPTRPDDKVEISQAAKLLSQLAKLPDVRQDLVQRVRGEIAKGTYETPDKLDKAIEGLQQDLT
jgi:negative regulator of flagellin synthesis FlgM